MLLFVVFSFNGFAFTLSEKAVVSIITCSPGNEMYSVYGHSAIRVKDPALNYDVAFNYGIFDFSSPNFLYRFCAGQTDYLLGAYRFNDFLNEYRHDKRSVFEQEINLTAQEKQVVVDFLVWNAQPENRVYRYNFFFDNCATRVRDVIANNVNGGITYTDKASHKTLRTLIKDYHGKLLWLNFGIDFLVAADSDREATLEEEMFLPDYVMNHFATAKRNDNNKLIAQPVKVLYLAPEQKQGPTWIWGPLVVFSFLLLVVAYFTYKQFRNGELKPALDIILYGINGLGGLLLTWFTIYSEHPAMSPNYNLMWLVPASLLFVVVRLRKKWRPAVRYYHLVFAAWMIVFFASASFLPQKFHPVFFILAATFFIRALAHSLLIFKSLKAARK
ncbi:DUF4105 domain-containing protein [Draconibacterium sp. IB214405]|uniref:lipoprotein N-acyltransferase Lnb domain-containing protein n=1 Tax=Draconibacterium sp. IB214405 TaxID=3097352 RepID=UPI002A1494C5|nr:DUF4105 domain-containing protein [Draconibacterium sp. IB214405]MDX8338449.1 DUF4105 domain-containing protein [Draconibacterium sp. IB214405]